MILLVLYLGLLLVPIALAERGRRGAVSRSTDAPPRRRPWLPEDTRGRVAIGVAFAAAAVAAIVRLQFPHVPTESCDDIIANIVNEAGRHGETYLHVFLLLAAPPLAISWFRRDSRWATVALLLMVAGFGACLNAAMEFDCPESPFALARPISFRFS